MKTLGIYVHIPYCIQKCRYCDFTSFANAPKKEYFEGLISDIGDFSTKYSKDRVVDTIFFGGGTPSLAPTDYLKAVLNAIKEDFNVSSSAEITTEANPETLTEDKVKELKEAGFNRISIGVQSFDDNILKAIGRVHDADKAREAINLSKKYFDNINIDLMFGLPYQTLDVWQKTLDEAISYKLPHISFYSLQIEEGTPLYKDYTNGIVDIPSWEVNRNMYHMAVKQLKDAGYHHYEISNASLENKECKHNLKYWNMQDYLGIGLAAHSFVDQKRFFNENGDYCNEEVKDSVYRIEDLKSDFVFTKLRLVDGFKLSEYKDMFGEDFLLKYGKPLEKLLKEGYLKISKDQKLSFTEKGLDNTNNVIEELI